MDPLKGCPFCGGDDARLRDAHAFVLVECPCGASVRGPTRNSKLRPAKREAEARSGAIAAWNRRSS